jgi:hypothetical protein
MSMLLVTYCNCEFPASHDALEALIEGRTQRHSVVITCYALELRSIYKMGIC